MRYKEYNDLHADDPMAHALVLFGENEEPIYRQEKAIYANLDKKVKSKKYDSNKASIAFRHQVDNIVKKYTAYYSIRNTRVINSSTRDKAACFLRDMYENERNIKIKAIHKKTR